eukprot:g6536.t1
MLDSSAKPSPDPPLVPQWLRCQSRVPHKNEQSYQHISQYSPNEGRRRGSQSRGMDSTPRQNPRAAPYLNERERDFDQLPRTQPRVHEVRQWSESGIMHTPSGPRMDSAIQQHSRTSSKFQSYDCVTVDDKNAIRRTLDATRSSSQTGRFSRQLSDSCTPDGHSGGNRLQPGTSRLADLPQSDVSYIRRTPDSSPELPMTPSFSKILHPESNAGIVDSIDRDRIRIEQSKKLIPVVSTSPCTNQRRSVKGKLGSNGALFSVHGVVSPINNNRKKQDWFSCHYSAQKRVLQKQDIGIGDSRGDRAEFFRSLRNNSGSDGKTVDSDFGPFLPRCVSENFMESSPMTSASFRWSPGRGRDSSNSNLTIESSELDNEADESYIDDANVPPPSLEEERWLRQLGWNGCSEASVLTDEEIAEFRADCLRRNVIKKMHKKQQQQQQQSENQTRCKTDDQFRSYRCSPIGHLSSYDLTAEDDEEEYEDDDGLSDPRLP